MNEQTAVELLKLANELMAFSNTKFGAGVKQGVNKDPIENTSDIFSECVKIVHDQYSQLTGGIKTDQ